MSHACTPILVGVVSLVLEIPLPSKTAKFPFPTMDYSPWSSKNLINRNWLKKFMKVDVDVTCMYTSFGVCSFFGSTMQLVCKNIYIRHGDFYFLSFQVMQLVK